MELVFLIYGLAFFLLGFAILYYPKKNSSFHLATKINFIGWFGILHGINEWLDLLIMVDALNISFLWKTFRLLTLPISFLFLLYFGTMVISTQKKNCRFCKFVTPTLFIIWAILFLAGDHNEQKWDILSRYILCFSGSLLSGLALFIYVPETENRNFKLAVNLKIAGITFIAYAFLSGLVVRDATFFPATIFNYSLFTDSLGVPVQVFRSVCAVIIAFNLIQVLKIFHLEVQRSLLDSEMRFRTVVNNVPVILLIEDENRQISFIQGKGLADMGIEPKECIGKAAAEVFSMMPAINAIGTNVFSLGKEISDVISVQGKFYEVFYSPLKDDRDNTSGAIGLIIDVSEQKNAQQKIDKYRIEMEKNKTLATIGALSSEIAGEIAGPLQDSRFSLKKAIRSLEKTINGDDITAILHEGINGISAAIDILNGFCEKADFKIPRQEEPIDLFDIVQRILSVFSESAKNAMVRITTNGTKIFPVMSMSNRELEQVLYIMVQTIIRSADSKSVHDLDIDFSMQNKIFSVKFTESYPGQSSMETRKTAFGSEILRGSDERSFDFSVVNGIVETYGGKMSIGSDPQDGISYEIQLPLIK